MRSVILFLRFLFSTNPAQVAHYTSPSMLALFALCAALFITAFALKMWRKRMAQANLRKLTQWWSVVAFWFGMIGLLLIVARVERIQLLAMPFWWVVWGLGLATFCFVQWRMFRSRYYKVLPNAAVVASDPYLPGNKRR